jgi:transcription initiation factor TFIIB
MYFPTPDTVLSPPTTTRVSIGKKQLGCNVIMNPAISTPTPLSSFLTTPESAAAASWMDPAIISMPPRAGQTKTKKKKSTKEEKDRLWHIFENDKRDIDESSASVLFEDVSAPLITEMGLCIKCNSILVIMEDGFPTCTNTDCAIIYSDTLDYSPEWRFYGAEDKNTNDPTRCGNPINPLLPESSYGCKVLCHQKASHEMKKISKWTDWQCMPHKEKALYDEFQFITIMAQNSGISKIFIDDAMGIYKDLSEQKMFRGMNRDGVKAASIYISCRLNGCPRTAHEISEIFKLDKPSATNGCSMAMNIIQNIERNTDPSQKMKLCTTTPLLFIERFCSKLKMQPELIKLSIFIAKKIEEHSSITDNIPPAIAAGIIYFVSHNCNLNITKTEIRKITGICDVTINKCFQKMEKMKGELIPSIILEKYK